MTDNLQRPDMQRAPAREGGGRRYTMKKAMIVVALLVPAGAARADWWKGAQGPEALVAAHRAYVAGDFEAMSRGLVETLEKHGDDPGITANALELLDKAYEARGKKGVPSGWKLPPEITELKLAERRLERDGVELFEMRIYGRLARAGVIRGLRLVALPSGEVILDRAKRIGAWEEGVDEEDDVAEFELESEGRGEPFADGLYQVSIELESGATAGGPVIMSGMAASTSPELVAPARGEKVAARRPTLQWKNYRSPELRPFEVRTAWLSVVRSEPPKYEWRPVFSRFLDDPAFTSLELPKDLEDGRYIFYLDFKETRRFGDVKVRRESSARHPFHIVGK